MHNGFVTGIPMGAVLVRGVLLVLTIVMRIVLVMFWHGNLLSGSG